MEADRELLELAAKAAGMIQDKPDWQHESLTVLAADGGWRRWNPLTDDGDALRLAVKLEMHVEAYPDSVEVFFGQGGHVDEGFSRLGSLPATRRAIVRAAAEIGRAMP